MADMTVRAPSSTANLGPGFDVFGLALDAFWDEIRLAETGSGGVSIAEADGTPADPQKNTAGVVISRMAEKFKTGGGIKIFIKKGVPAGFGMGSSAASAAAAAVAFDKLFELKLDADSLVRFAGMGETASAGIVHYDNVAASVLGGFVLVRNNPPEVIRIEPPEDLRLCIAIPELDIPAKKTEVARGMIPEMVKFSDSIKNLSNAAYMAAGFVKKNTDLIGSSVRDVIVEPARRSMIPGFDGVKSGALGAGAMGVSISGAGPSVIAFAKESSDLDGISSAMKKGFASADTACRLVICRPGGGATPV